MNTQQHSFVRGCYHSIKSPRIHLICLPLQTGSLESLRPVSLKWDHSCSCSCSFSLLSYKCCTFYKIFCLPLLCPFVFLEFLYYMLFGQQNSYYSWHIWTYPYKSILDHSGDECWCLFFIGESINYAGYEQYFLLSCAGLCCWCNYWTCWSMLLISHLICVMLCNLSLNFYLDFPSTILRMTTSHLIGYPFFKLWLVGLLTKVKRPQFYFSFLVLWLRLEMNTLHFISHILFHHWLVQSQSAFLLPQSHGLRYVFIC